jgi:RNA polymerase sigma-19 factor, ECF subfamily
MNPSAELVRLRSGDRIAFDQIAKEHGAGLEAVARRVLRCSENAAEVVQDVLFRLWRDRERLAIEGPIGPYLRRAVRNRALDQLKRRRVESRWREREVLEQTGSVGRPADQDHSADWDRAVLSALGDLPVKRRQAILLRWCHDLSYQEIADRLCVSVKTIENQIGRGLKSLRTALGARRVKS